jgi:hypothetical protein
VSVTDSGLELKMIPTPTTSLHINSLYITATTTYIYMLRETERVNSKDKFILNKLESKVYLYIQYYYMEVRKSIEPYDYK